MRVLVAIDHSEFINCISDYITQREWPPHTEFLIVHFIEKLSPPITALPDQVQAMIETDSHQEGGILVRNLALKIRDAFKTEHVHEEVIDGCAKHGIVQRAIDWKADLIVVGSHNRNFFDRVMLGSVSSAVMALAPCHVAIVRNKHVSKKAHSEELKTSLVIS